MSQSALPRSKLGELLRIKHGYAFRGEYFADSGPYIVVTPGNFRDEGGFKQKDGKEKCYVGPVPDGYVLKRGELVVVMTEQAEGLLGSAAWIPEDELYLHNQRIGLITAVEERELHAGFLYYLLNDRSVRAQIRASAGGTKVRHTSPSRIYEVEIGLPPLREQRRIAAVLSAYDDLIENNLWRIRILEEMAQAIYREWFVHFRFPGHEKATMVDSPLGVIPGGWEVCALSDVADVNARSIKPRTVPERIAYIDIASVTTGSVDKVQLLEFADAPSRARRLVQHGDVIWSSVRPNLKSYSLVLHPQPNLVVSTGFAVISPRTVPFSYLYCAVTTDTFAAYLTNRTTGAAYPAVNAADFEAAQVVRPPSPLLDRFHQIGEPILELRHSLLLSNVNLRATRDLVLPRLISGELDVSDLEIAVPEVAA